MLHVLILLLAIACVDTSRQTIRTFPYRCRPSTTIHLTHSRRTRSSIVTDLIDRSVTGSMPPMETHLHSDSVVVALWNNKNIEGCFQNCILRYTIDKETTVQLRRCLKCFSEPRFCNFGQVCINNCYVRSIAFMRKRYNH
jgi:hypothetical protein